MPTSDKTPDLLVDTSVAVAFSVADHEQHDAVFEELAGRRLGLAGHAAFETFSVLTRMPTPGKLTPAAAIRILQSNFPHTLFLSPSKATDLLTKLAAHGIAGGSVYDALVASAAKEHRVPLVTRDRRAVPTYRKLNVNFELLADAKDI